MGTWKYLWHFILCVLLGQIYHAVTTSSTESPTIATSDETSFGTPTVNYTETSALPVSTVILDSSTVARTATSRFTTNLTPQTEVSQITGSSNTVPKTVPVGSTSSDTTDTESKSPPTLTNKVSSTSSVTVTESSLGIKSTKSALSPVTSESNTQEDITSSSNQRTLNDVTATDQSHSSLHSTAAETPSTDTEKSSLPVSTVILDSSTVAPTATSHFTTNLPPQTEVSQITGSSNTVPKTVPVGSTSSDTTDTESKSPPTLTNKVSSTASATVTESSLGITSTKGALSPVTSESNTQEDITSSSNQRTLNDVTATDQSHSSLHSTAAETPSTDTEKSALPVSTVILDSSTVAPTATSHFTTNLLPQSEVSQITGSSNTVPKTVPVGNTSSDTTDTESKSPPSLTNKVSSTSSATATESSLGITSSKGALSPVTSESNTQEDITSSSNQRTLNDVTATDQSHSSLDSTAAETPNTDTEKSALPVSTVILDSSTVAPTATSHFTTNLLPQSEVSQITGSSNTVPKTVPVGSTNSDTTDTESKSPPTLTNKVSSTSSATATESSLGITSTKGALSPVTSESNTQEDITSSSNQRTLNDVTATERSHTSLHSTAAETPSTDTEKSALPVSTVILDSSTGAPTATSHLSTNLPPQTEVSQITGSSNTVPKTVPVGSTSSDTTDTESKSPPTLTNKVSSTASATVTESSLGITSTKGALSPVTSESNTQEDITSSSNQRTLNDVTATDQSHSSLHSTAAETPSTDTEKSALPVSTVILDSSTVAPTATSHFSTNLPPQTEVSQITGSSNTVPKTVPVGSTSSDTTDTESKSPPTLTNKVSSTASATVTESSLGITSTKGALSPVTSESNTQEDITSSSNQRTLNDVTATEWSHSSLHSTAAETPSTDTEKSALPVSTVILDSSTVAPTATSHFNTNLPPQTEVSQITGSSNTVPKTVPVGSTSSDTADTESKSPPTLTNKVSSTASATVTESSLGITSTKGALSPVTSESNTQEDITSSSNQRTLNDVTATDQSHSSLHSTAAETPSTDTEKSALPVSTVILDSSTVAPTATSHFTTNLLPQSEVSQITGSSNTVPKTVPVGSTSSDTTDTESKSPPSLTNKVSSTSSATATESSLGITSTKGALSPVTSESNTQEDITSSSNQRTLNDVTATDQSHSSLHSTAAETPNTDTEKSALPVSTVILDSSTVVPTATSHFSTNLPPQSEISQITGSSNTVPKTVPVGSTNSDTTDTESKRPPTLTNKVSSTSSATVTESSLGITSTKSALSPVTSESNTQEDITSSSNQRTLNDVTATERSHTSLHSTAAETPSTDTEKSALPVSTVILDSSTGAPTATSHFSTNLPPQTEVSKITGSSNTVPKTVPVGSTNSDTTDTESKSPPTLTNKVSSSASATVTESSLGITSTKGALSPVTSESNTQEDITSSSNQRTLNDVTATDQSHSSLHSTAAETPSTDTEKSALPVSTVILDSSTGAPTATSHLSTNLPPQTEVSKITGSSNTVPKTVPVGSTNSDTTDTESKSPPTLTNKVSSTASATVTESSLGITSTKGALSPVTSESNTQEDITSSSNQRTLNDVTATDQSHSSLHSTAAETPSTDTEKSALPVSTVILDSSTGAPTATSHLSTNLPPQTEVSKITGSSNTVPKTVPVGSTNSDTTDTESKSPPTLTNKVSSTASATVTESSLGITSTKGALSPVTSESNTQEDITSSSNQRTLNDVTATDQSHSSLHSTAAETPSTDTEKSSLPVSTVILDSSTVAPTATSPFTTNLPPQTEVSQITGSSNTVAKTVPVGSTSSDTTDTESKSPPTLTNKVSSTASATVTESSLGITSTKGALSPVTSESNTQEDITSSSNQRTLNDVTATDQSHSSLHSTAAETPSTDTEKSALPVSTDILDSSTVAPTATSHFTTNLPPQTEVSQITGSSNTVPKTVPVGSTSSDTTDTESKSPPTLTNKVSSTASATVTESSLGITSTKGALSPVTSESNTQEDITSSSNQRTLNDVTATEWSHSSLHSTAAETPSTDTEKSALPVSTVILDSSTVAPTATSHFNTNLPPQTEVSQITGSSNTVPKTVPVGSTSSDTTDTESKSPPTLTNKVSSTASATVTESSLGITSTKGALSPVTSESNTQEDITSSSNQRTLNDVTATEWSHSSLHSTAAETPSTDTEKSALPVSTVILDSSTVAPTATSHFNTNLPPQTEVSQITGSSNTVPKTVPVGSTSSDTTDTESKSPPTLTNKVSSTASATVTESSLGITSTKGALSPVTSESNTQEDITSSSNQRTLNDVTATEWSHSSLHSTAAETPSTDTEKSALPVSTVILESSTVAPTATSHFNTNLPPQTEVSQITGSSNTVPKTVPVGSTNSDTADTESKSPPTLTNKVSSTASATVTESSLGITSTKGALSPVTSESNTQEDITSSSNQRTLNDVTATDQSHSSLHSTAAETPSTDTEKSALPVSTVILDSSTVVPTATSHFSTNLPPQTEVSQITGSSNTVPKTVPMGSTNSDTTDTESKSPPTLTNKVSSTASVASELGEKSTIFLGTSPMTHLSTMAETPAEISSTTIFSSALTGLDTSFSLTSVTSSSSSSISNPVQISTVTDMINGNETITMSSTTPKSILPITVPNTTIPQFSFTFSTPNISVSPPTTATIVSASPTKTSLTIKSTVIVATIVTAGDTSSKNTNPTVRITAPDAGTVSATAKSTLSQGTCTSLIFSIQLEKVTSEVIQFNWTPQGGTRDSPYTVYLLGDNTVRNKSTTNETWIAFGDLVPGYEYIISVEVLTCAKKINTSRRVRTEAKTFGGKTRITNKEFKPAYNNKSSEEFKDFEKRFIAEIRKNLPPEMQRLLDEGKLRIVINNLRSGSIDVDFMIVLDVRENLTKTELTAAFTEAFNNSTEFQTDSNSTVIEEKNSCEMELNDCSEHATCNISGPSYSCQCQAGFTDFSPNVPGRDCRAGLSSTASPTERISTGSSGTSSTDTSRVTMIVKPSTNSSSSTTKMPTRLSTISVTPPYRTTTSGACTSLDFSIQLENVTSDMIQFNWTPQGGGIAYTASLFGDEAVKKNTTYKTSIAYEHLLPGQEYIISVEVLNCGKKTNTSMTVQTASKNFKGQTRLIDKVFNPQYRNKSSAAFKDFEKNFTDEIGGKLTGEFKNLFDMRKMRIVIDSLSNGSVTVLFNTVMPVQQNIIRTTVFDALIIALNKSALGRVDFNSTFIEAANSCETVPKVCSEYASCIPEEATYSCKCKDGFYDHSPRVPGRDCRDINECATNTSSCSRLATCNNTVGSYECNCNPRIKDENPTNPGRQCKDPVLCFSSANLCSTQNNDCLDSKDQICSSKQAFACEILFKNLVFGPELYNFESQRYQNLSQSITTDVVNQTRISLRDNSFVIIVVGFRPGSVIAYFVSLLQGQQSIDANTLQANLSKIVKNVFGNETEVTVQSIPTSSEKNLAWKTAVIVLGVLLGVALIFALLILSVCLWMRSTAGEYWLEPKGLLGNFAYHYL